MTQIATQPQANLDMLSSSCYLSKFSYLFDKLESYNNHIQAKDNGKDKHIMTILNFRKRKRNIEFLIKTFACFI